MSDIPRTPSPYETSIRLGNEVDQVRQELSAERQRTAELNSDLRYASDQVEAVAKELEAEREKVQELEKVAVELGFALHRSRGQWIHSVNADYCANALAAFKKLKGEG